MQDSSLPPQRKINICYLIDNLIYGGTENHLLRLIHGIDKNRFNPVLMLLDGENDESRQMEPDSCEVVRLGIRSFLRPSIVSHVLRFRKQLRTRRIDVMQMHFPDSTLFGALCGKLAGVPVLVGTRRNAGYWMTPIHRIRGRIVNRIVTKIIANNESSKNSVIEQEHAKRDSVVVILNGVELNRFGRNEIVDEDCLPCKLKRIGILANLRPVKRIEDFVLAASKILSRRDDCLFEIIGEGAMRAELENLIDRLGIKERVRLVGAVSDVAKYLNRLSVLVCCSSSEGLSNSMLEAMASSLPIVATDIEGNRTLIKSNETGLLYEVGNIESLTNLLIQLLDNEQLSTALGEGARRFVERNFSQTVMIQRYEELYVGLLNGVES